jgi:hypothetical protein
MSCDVAAAVFLMFAAHAPAEPAVLIRAADPVASAKSLAAEPLFADIVGRAGRLLGFTNGYRDLLKEDPEAPLPEFAVFKTELRQLADLDAKAVEQLEARALDSDLKCILRGISADIGVKIDLLSTAADGKARDKALRELAYLLNDNVEVIKAPPAPPA